MRTFLRFHLQRADGWYIAAITLLFIAAVGGLFWQQARQQTRLVESTVLQSAEQYSGALKEFRTLYSSEVVKVLTDRGIVATHDYQDTEGTIPLPATLSMMLGNRLADQNDGGHTRLYSPYPFPWREKTGGLKDQFGQAAWEFFQNQPDQPFYRFEQINGTLSLRYATADVMRRSCVDCHNNHADTPRRGWKEGDVRGILEVSLPLDSSLAQAQANRLESFLSIGVVFVLGLFTVGIMINGFRGIESELERRVKNRTLIVKQLADRLEERVKKRTNQLSETNVKLKKEIKDRKQFEKEALEHRERLAHVTRLSSMSELATGLAHELNQPLTAIATYGYAGKLALGDTASINSKQLQELFEKMTAQAIRAGEIIRRLRSLVGKRTPVRSSVDIIKPIQEVLNLMESDARQREVRVELRPDHSNRVATMDEIQIQQVLVNLVRNALDSMNETEPDRRTLKITTSITDGGLIEVAVCDTGKGIPVESADQVFDAFFSRKSEGMGMGLAISRTIIASHGGRMWMMPNSDCGVTLHFTIPVAKKGSGNGSSSTNSLCAGR